MIITIDETTRLESLAEKHVMPLFTLADANRLHLREWLPWVDRMLTVEHFSRFVAEAKKQYAENAGFAFVIMSGKDMAGRIGVYHVDHQNKTGSIGYWLGTAFEGRGLVTKACRAVVDFAFDTLLLNRIEIRCGTGNLKSKAIAERLHFTLEGITRQGERVNNRYIDLYVYAMLKEDWETARGRPAP